MSKPPTIVRVVLAKDWMEAFKTLWIASFGRLAADYAGMTTYVKWPERRRLARVFAEQCIDECNDAELAVAWTCLADPAGPELYRHMFGALAAAIVAEPALLDDDAFARAVASWRSLVNVDLTGEQDVFAAAARPALEVDKAETLAWARLFFALAGAITSNPDLIDDDTFARAVMGWRFLGKFGIGAEQDPILAAHLLGACLDGDKDELRRWAQTWSGGTS